jgi:hypothetical protein
VKPANFKKWLRGNLQLNAAEQFSFFCFSLFFLLCAVHLDFYCFLATLGGISPPSLRGAEELLGGRKGKSFVEFCWDRRCSWIPGEIFAVVGRWGYK